MPAARAKKPAEESTTENPWLSYFRSLPRLKDASECGAPSCRKKSIGTCTMKEYTVDGEGKRHVGEKVCGVRLCEHHSKSPTGRGLLCPWHEKRAREEGLIK